MAEAKGGKSKGNESGQEKKAAVKPGKEPESSGIRDAWDILMFPQLAEKSMNMVEMENKLVFVVKKKASKKEIKEAIESKFSVNVIKVNVEVTRKGQKKAYIKLHPDDSAADIASRMGML